MGERDRRGAPGRGKPDVRKRISDIERVQGEHGRKLRELSDLLHIKDNSAAEMKAWVGEPFTVIMNSGREYHGTLKWIDKYNVAVLKDGCSEPSVLPKGNIESMKPGKE